jgi:cytochrome c553
MDRPRTVAKLHRAGQVSLVLLLLPELAWGYMTAKQELEQAMRSVPHLTQGADLFRKCAVCHGSDGGGTRDGTVPRIAGQHVSVLVKQLVDYRHNRRWDIRMEHFAGKDLLADAQSLADVAAHIHQLQPVAAPGIGDGELAPHGQNVYGRLCDSCHGGAGQGDSVKAVPRIAGQHFDYLLRQMYDAAHGLRPNFSTTHIRLLGRLDRRDIVGLADYLSRLNPKNPDPAAVALAR